MTQAFFGKPQATFTPGGAHVAVYLVPVFEGRLTVFEVEAPGLRGRWLPWTVMGYGENPYETAAALADDWCDGAVAALEIADALSFPFDADGWELALVYRAELTALPAGDAHRRPVQYPPGEADAIGPFDPVDLVRWVEAGGGNRETGTGRREAGGGNREPGGGRREEGGGSPEGPLVF
ncbi:hypothetical protein [Tepidiforma sp.]|uniref:hypothetical protein n=1 Tax=Tepidiforma sp. TaxID=2682230 RepID=UPI002639F055|nr:hypothetical protein [Tepidiforma sp.]MCX7616987.1 hypothetical protein [Tepidiforma sp.]